MTAAGPAKASSTESWLAGLTRRRCSCWAEKRTRARASAATASRGRGLPVDEGAGAPLGRNAAGEDHLALVVGELAQRERGVVVLEAVPEPVRHRQGRLDQRVAGPGPHRRRVGGRAGQEAERLCEHGLPRPGLAGDRGQARRRGQLGVLDHDEVADLERPDHGRPNFSR